MRDSSSGDSWRTICTDFYVNQKLSLKMDLPGRRDTVLDLFDRVRRDFPMMDRLRRYPGELALESREDDHRLAWLAIRRTSIRSGWVNPADLHESYRLHRLLLELTPYFLSISPLDVESLELVYGFDLGAETNRNAVVFDALFGDSPLRGLIGPDQEAILDSQPFVGFSLSPRCDLQAYVEVKTRTRSREVARNEFQDQPISVYLTVRKYGPLRRLEDLVTTFGTLAGHIERLAEQRVIPHVVMPIRETLLSR